MVREPLDVEDPDNGLYLHTVEPMVQRDGFGERIYVEAADFMAVQRERDTYRSALALINGLLADPDVDHWQLRDRARRVLDNAGMDAKDGRAVVGLMRWAEQERAAQTEEGTG